MMPIGENRGRKLGRCVPHKVPFVAAVSTDEEQHPIAIRFSKLERFSKAEIARWAAKHLESASMVISDGLDCFSAVSAVGCKHITIVACGARIV